MSWYGSHINSNYSKKFIKSLLPPAACKLCIYRIRHFLTVFTIIEYRYLWKEIEYSRCGLKINTLTLARQLGLRNPEAG